MMSRANNVGSTSLRLNPKVETESSELALGFSNYCFRQLKMVSYMVISVAKGRFFGFEPLQIASVGRLVRFMPSKTDHFC